MKKITLILSLFFAVGICYAEIVPSSTLNAVAKNYLQLQNPSRTYTVSSVHREGIAPIQNVLEANALINWVSFSGGGWIMLSNNLNAPPVLAYSEEGSFDYDTNNMPGGLITLIESYKDELLWIRDNGDYLIQSGQGSELRANRQKWTDLQNPNSVGAQKIQSLASNARSLNINNLLNDPLRGENPQWGQSRNNGGGCSPAYNTFHPGKNVSIVGCVGVTGNDCNVDCERKPAGCASIAMAQLMRYWKFPPQYDWEEMPTAIYSSTESRKGNNIARLIRDCGDAANTTYCCMGAYTTTNKIVDAFHGSLFMYPTAEKKTKKDNDNDQWWPLLIKAEIDNGRPVIYRGDKCDLCVDKHIWIVSGYNGDDLFYCNWGWRGSYNSYYSLSDLKPGGSNFRKNNMIVLNIKPNWNVTNDPYLTNISQGSGTALRTFGRNISLSNVTLNAGSSAKICATSSITINGQFTVQGDADVTFLYCDAATEMSAINAPQSSPKDKDTPLSNNENLELTEDSTEEILSEEFINQNVQLSSDNEFHLYPNPTIGEFYIHMGPEWTDNTQKDVSIYDLNGALVLQTNFIGNECTIKDLHKKGTYIVSVYTPQVTFKKRLIIK